MASWLGQFLLLVSVAVIGVVSVVPQQCSYLAGCSNYDGKVAKLEHGRNLYYVVGALFNIRNRGNNAFTCGTGFNPRGILHTQAFLFSLDYWRNQLQSTSVGIGGVVFDSCGRTEQMIQNVLGFEQCNIRITNVDRHNLVGFVGPEDNAQALAAATLTKDMDLTVISPAADSPQLSDKAMFPYFLRTSPSTSVDAEILALFLKGIKTKYVAVIYDENDMSDLTELKRQMSLAGICVTDSFGVSGAETETMLDYFINTKLGAVEMVRYVVFLASQPFGERLLKRVTELGRLRSQPYDLVFLFPSSIQKTASMFSGANTAADNSILLERQEPEISVIKDAVNSFKQYWKDLNATAQSPKGNDTFLSEFRAAGNSLPAYDSEAAFTIMATRAFVYGVYGAGNSECRSGNAGNYLCSSFDLSEGRGSMINGFIRGETSYFSTSTDVMRTVVPYTIHRYANSFMQVGTYNGTHVNVDYTYLNAYIPGKCQDNPCLKCNELPPTTTPKPTTTTTAPRRCEPNTNGNFSIVYYPPNQEITGAYMQSPRNDSEYATRFDVGQKWIIALGVLAGLGIFAVIVFEIYILYKLLGTTLGNKWRTMWLGQLLLFGIFLCYLTCFAYLPIPTKATCGITRFGVGVSYSICFAVLLVKLMVILTSKSSDSSIIPGDMESPNYLKGIYQFLMFVFVVGVQVVIDTQWLITVPPEAVKVISNAGSEVWVCNHYTFRASASEASPSLMTNIASFVRNEFENHILSLVYIMFLMLICSVLALNSHGIITNHRESVFIGIAAGFSIPIWLAWTLLGGLNRNHMYAHEFGDGCIAFGLFLTATLILFSMFLPKVRQLVNMGVEGIYFEDDRDTYYAGSVIMAPSYKSRPNSVIYVNNQGIYSEPVVLGNGDTGSNYFRHPGYPSSVYSAPPTTYVKRGADSTRGGSVLRVTDDLSGKRPLEKKRPQSELAYATAGRPRSTHGTLPRSRSQSNLGAL